MLELSTYLKERRDVVNAALDHHLPHASERPTVLHEAMRYSVMAGGKRIRPILCLAAAEAVGADVETALLPALAVEILHTYTLIHDDLPCMDDDDLRRGMPTAHVKFGEAEAVLAGDALLTLAFEWVAGQPAPKPYGPTQLVQELAHAGGSRGVIAGQIEDLAGEGRDLDAEDLEFIHVHKTASLIRGAIRIGAIAGGASPDELDDLTMYGGDIGLAFQIADDVLNVTSSKEDLGKPVGSDAQRAKSTYVSMYGLERAREMANSLVDNAVACLPRLPGSIEPLEAIARYIVTRGN
jgi:geranylgeranyl diphosphate synthase type II